MFSSPETLPCQGYPTAVMFPDVEPDVLAAEAEVEQSSGGHLFDTWHVYLRRVLPALEGNAPREMAQALFAAGHDARAASSHAETMRRRALGIGNVRRARFWADVAHAVLRLQQPRRA